MQKASLICAALDRNGHAHAEPCSMELFELFELLIRSWSWSSSRRACGSNGRDAWRSEPKSTRGSLSGFAGWAQTTMFASFARGDVVYV